MRVAFCHITQSSGAAKGMWILRPEFFQSQSQDRPYEANSTADVIARSRTRERLLPPSVGSGSRPGAWQGRRPGGKIMVGGKVSG